MFVYVCWVVCVCCDVYARLQVGVIHIHVQDTTCMCMHTNTPTHPHPQKHTSGSVPSSTLSFAMSATPKSPCIACTSSTCVEVLGFLNENSIVCACGVCRYVACLCCSIEMHSLEMHCFEMHCVDMHSIALGWQEYNQHIVHAHTTQHTNTNTSRKPNKHHPPCAPSYRHIHPHTLYSCCKVGLGISVNILASNGDIRSCCIMSHAASTASGGALWMCIGLCVCVVLYTWVVYVCWVVCVCVCVFCCAACCCVVLHVTVLLADVLCCILLHIYLGATLMHHTHHPHAPHPCAYTTTPPS